MLSLRSVVMPRLHAILLAALGVVAVLSATAPSALSACPSTVSIACGEAQSGSIAVVGETDCFTFTAQAGETVSVHEAQSGAGYNTCVELLAPDSTSLGFNCGGELERPLDAGGTYTIQVSELGNDSTGSYHVSLTVVSDTASSCAVPIACGQTLARSIATPTENDTFSFTSRAGDVVSVTTTKTADGVNACWELYTPAGSSLGGACGQSTKVLANAGHYTVRAFDNGNDGAGPYNVNLTVVSETASSCAETIACGQTLSRAIGTVAESDTFTFATLLPNEAVRVTTSDQGLALNACWQLYDPTGGPLASACDLAAEAVLSTPGTHTIRVSDEDDNTTGNYDVSLQCLGTPTPTAVPTATTTSTPTEAPTSTAAVSSTATPPDAETPTVTPTATGETPTITPSPSPTPTPTPSPGETVSATASTTPRASPTAPGQPTPPPRIENLAAAKLANSCQRTIKKAGAVFVTARLTRLAKCAGGVFACAQAKAGDLTTCFESARTSCTRDLGKIAIARAKLVDVIAGKCEPVGAPDLLRPAGLGYESLRSTCLSEFTTTLPDVPSIAECLARQHECRADQLLSIELPRAAELLRVHDLNLPPGSCLEDLGGTGPGLGDPAGEGKALDKCRKATTAAGKSFVATALKRLQKCADAVFTCVQTKPGEDPCLARAQVTCARASAKLDGDTAKLRAAVDRTCGGVSPAALVSATGANAGGLAGLCGPYGVTAVGTLGSYQDCLARQHLCHVEELLRFESPRTAELFGLVDASLPGPCPSP